MEIAKREVVVVGVGLSPPAVWLGGEVKHGAGVLGGGFRAR